MPKLQSVDVIHVTIQLLINESNSLLSLDHAHEKSTQEPKGVLVLIHCTVLIVQTLLQYKT